MQDQYKKSMDQIHAPKGLVEKTKKKMLVMEKELEKKPNKAVYRWGKVLAAAACIGLVLFGGYQIYAGRTQIIVGNVKLEQGMNLGMNLGQISSDKTVKEEGYQVYQGSAIEEVQEPLWEIKASKIKRMEVHIGYDDVKNIYYAAYEQDKIYHYIIGEDKTKEEFLSFLKKRL